jgi:hypothetical protein
MDERGGYGGIGFGGALFLLFLGLKLGGVIAWSWWWVLAPIWIPLLIGGALGAGALLAAAASSRRYDRRADREWLERQRLARRADRDLYDEWGHPRG